MDVRAPTVALKPFPERNGGLRSARSSYRSLGKVVILYGAMHNVRSRDPRLGNKAAIAGDGAGILLVGRGGRIMAFIARFIGIICCLLAWLPAAAAQSERRVALVIGNAAYRAVAGLPNPRKDAGDVAAALRSAA